MTSNSAAPAVVFDVDGTLVDSERYGHRVAFNEALAAFGLPYVWDEATYGRLLATAGGRQRLRTFLLSQGHAEGEADELAGRLHEDKTARFIELCRQGRVPARPGVEQLLDGCAQTGSTIAVATTGTRDWVAPLLERNFGLQRFHLLVTGSEVPRRKPASDVYDEVLRQLPVERPGDVVAVEDSANGLAAASAAGVPCVIVVNDYTRQEDFSGAELVVDGFREATVWQGCAELLEDGAVTAGTLAGLCHRADPPR